MCEQIKAGCYALGAAYLGEKGNIRKDVGACVDMLGITRADDMHCSTVPSFYVMWLCR